MIAVLQRVSKASVEINGQIHGQITTGFLILLGVAHLDSEEDIAWLVKKIVGMRVFGDEQGKMNLDIGQVNGNILLVSQFTLHASVLKGNRPSFTDAAKPELAMPLYQKMADQLTEMLQKPIATGEFGANMKVSLLNDGPVTIILNSKNRS